MPGAYAPLAGAQDMFPKENQRAVSLTTGPEIEAALMSHDEHCCCTGSENVTFAVAGCR